MSAAVDGGPAAGNVLRNEPMARHTSWRVGGPADAFYRPATLDELRALLSSLGDGVPVHWIGFGSNLLVRDGGIRGVVICTSELPKDVERVAAAGVRAGAGVACANLARRCVEWRLGPAAFFAGIPGTLGGALAMNAGAFGGETWNDVIRVETIDRHGTVRFRERSDYRIGYRSVHGADGEWFLAATFRLRAEFAEDRDTLTQLLGRRRETQPIGKPTAGSVFRNPPDAHAGDLIEKAGLKGFQLGGARVSDKHANFIVNTGNATARDIEALIETVRGRVREAFGIELELEVRVLGDAVEGEGRAR